VQLSWPLRIVLYIQLLLGMDRLSKGGGQTMSDLHLGLGIIVAVLALIVFRPLPELAGKPPLPIRTAARFAPLAPLAVGLGFRFLGWSTDMDLRPVLIPLHIALAFAAVALVEIAAARTRRLLAPEELVVKREGA
jgi:hypothetical protein